MSTDSGWWARKLGGQPQSREQQYPPQNYQPQPAPSYTQPSNGHQEPGLPPGTMGIMDAVQRWQGGPAARTDRQPCPMCGSSHYFSRTDGIMRGPAPAPLCYSCGYNGMHMQGDPAVWQTGSV